MRGDKKAQNLIFFSVDVEQMIPPSHPLRDIKRRTDAILRRMHADFDAAYATGGRPSIPPERLLGALLLKAFYSIPSDRKLEEAIRFNMLYRWFLDMTPDEPMWTAETFTKNRERFEKHELFRKFFDAVVTEALLERAASTDHFSVDGTLIRSWASAKSLEPVAKSGASSNKNDDDGDPPADAGNPWVDFRGERRTNDTHRSRTDPQARLMKKGRGKEAHLSHMGHFLMENRNGLLIDVYTSEANGRAEREAARKMLSRVRMRHLLMPRTLGADTGYDAGPFLRQLWTLHRTVPHIPVRRGAIKGHDVYTEARREARRRMKQVGYAASQRIRKRIEEAIGWTKTVAGLARTKLVGRWKLGQELYIAATAWNLLRLTKITAAAAA